VQCFQHRQVIVDDEIEDRIEDVVGAVGQRNGAGFAALAHRSVRDGRAVANRDDVSLAHEEVRLAERDAATHELRGSRHDEETRLILLELGPLMGLAGVLDGEWVQVELSLHLIQHLGAGFVQSDPDDVAGPLRPLTCLREADLGHAAAVHIGARGNQAEVFIGRSENLGVRHHETSGLGTRVQGT